MSEHTPRPSDAFQPGSAQWWEAVMREPLPEETEPSLPAWLAGLPEEDQLIELWLGIQEAREETLAARKEATERVRELRLKMEAALLQLDRKHHGQAAEVDARLDKHDHTLLSHEASLEGGDASRDSIRQCVADVTTLARTALQAAGLAFHRFEATEKRLLILEAAALRTHGQEFSFPWLGTPIPNWGSLMD
jgi:hypothetical protein